MRIVTEVTAAYCGDVKDYEGDGAFLYFGSIAQTTRVALAIRATLTTVQLALIFISIILEIWNLQKLRRPSRP
jgi:hypothetical protein